VVTATCSPSVGAGMQQVGEDDALLVDYDDEVVRSSDLATLHEGQWLNDAVRTYLFTRESHVHRFVFAADQPLRDH
jgi:hypothetical protein